ncbi:MAG: hypothetical protein HC861_00220 [Rhodospirillaceae bacterium]|nr:hypothetical protein [Rhodospirillaceae bacterium]
MRYWLISVVLAAATHGATAGADEPARASPAAANPSAPSAGKEIKPNSGRPTSASEPLVGSYQFLLEVAGVTPGERQRTENQTYSTGPGLRRNPRTTINLDD